ncbi:MAG: helix-hairpin-helix domain-containing protein [Bacteroidales bacterium]
MKRILLINFLLLSMLPVASQETPMLEELTEKIIENGDETDAERVHEMLSDLLRNPLNLNTSSERDLNSSGLFTPFQAFGIIKYREKYGPFFSIYELAAIPGFTQEMLKAVAPLIALSEGPGRNSRQVHKGMLLTNLAIRLPSPLAYLADSVTAPHYPGSPLKFTSRLRYDAGERWTAGAAFEKDPGERWMNGNNPEHFTGYLAYNSDKLLSKMILGNFRIHRGMGLIHGLGFNSGGTGVTTDGYRRSYAKPFASTMEYDYYRGVYAEVSKQRWTADLFCSVRPEDISLFRLKAPANLFDQIRRTGLHRTDPERNGFNLARQYAAGLSVNRSAEKWYIGWSATGSKMELSDRGRDSVNLVAPGILKEEVQGGLSFYGVGFGKGYELFGEVAVDHHASMALLAGGTFEINPALLLNLSFRSYQVEYNGQTPKAYGAKTKPENETGINCGINIAPFSNARLYLFTDISGESNVPGYGSDPGFFIRNNIQFGYAFTDGPDLEFRITGRSRQKKLSETGPGNGSYATNQQQKYRLNGSWDLSEKLVLSGRIELAILQSGGEKQTGKVIYSQVKVIPKEKIRLTYRYLAFNSNHWENRIYTYEPGVRYSFLFPAWYGKGTRNILTVSAKLNRWLTVRSKLGMTAYTHRRETGSGQDVRPGNRIWDCELQIQLDF